MFHGLSGRFYFISSSLKPSSGVYKECQLEFNENRIIRVVTKIVTNNELRSGYEVTVFVEVRLLGPGIIVFGKMNSIKNIDDFYIFP